jgi:hypothetical protein
MLEPNHPLNGRHGAILVNFEKWDHYFRKVFFSPPHLLKIAPTGRSHSPRLLFIVHRCCFDLHRPPSPSTSPPTTTANRDPFIIDDFLKDYDFSPTLTPTISRLPVERANVSWRFMKIIISNLKKHSWSDLPSEAQKDLLPDELIRSPNALSCFNSMHDGRCVLRVYEDHHIQSE